MKNEMSSRIKALFEGQDTIVGRLDAMEAGLDEMLKKAGRQDSELQIIEGGGKKQDCVLTRTGAEDDVW